MASTTERRGLSKFNTNFLVKKTLKVLSQYDYFNNKNQYIGKL